MKIRIQIHREDDGSYWADSPDAVGCYTVGQTIDETLVNMREALLCHLDLTDVQEASLRVEPMVSAEFRMKGVTQGTRPKVV